MSQELKALLRSVLKEELQPIYERLEFVEQTLKHLTQLTSKEEWLLNDLQLMKQSTHLTMSHLKVKYDVLLDRIIEHEKEILNLKTRLPN
ncbi:hypothetical protein SAMN05216169_10444 [Anoxybacillus pushchinoensis]|uniref:Uncharacterized protein n=1 Tax=Anoxybacillus pushchinoensis TaxID=150248 RepID=A0A1I0TSZ8_9BACL|nr:hypothetical protein [Anoxybacillus pushchinoensis]SFA54852.1 hypothetical protein SAMN05216169_10444 [Anoxybacillus pushchinoensis]